jgi:hypothetical protein
MRQLNNKVSRGGDWRKEVEEKEAVGHLVVMMMMAVVMVVVVVEEEEEEEGR